MKRLAYVFHPVSYSGSHLMSQSNMADGLSAGRNIIVMSLNHFLGSPVSQTVNHRVRNPASDASQVQV